MPSNGSQNLGLDRSGEVRVSNEFESLKFFLTEDINTILFGLKEISTSKLREDNVDSKMGDIVGNGFVEIFMRYGLVYILLLIKLFTSFVRKKDYLSFFLFFMLIVQIDGAIAKPFVWFYIILFIIKKNK